MVVSNSSVVGICVLIIVFLLDNFSNVVGMILKLVVIGVISVL